MMVCIVIGEWYSWSTTVCRWVLGSWLVTCMWTTLSVELSRFLQIRFRCFLCRSKRAFLLYVRPIDGWHGFYKFSGLSNSLFSSSLISPFYLPSLLFFRQIFLGQVPDSMSLLIVFDGWAIAYSALWYRPICCRALKLRLDVVRLQYM